MHNDNTLPPVRRVRRSRRVAAAVAGVSALALLAAACGGDDDDGAAPIADAAAASADTSGAAATADTSGEPTVEIMSPADGAQVGDSFDVALAINFAIGEPDTGRNHVHLYYDGNMAQGEYGIAYEDEFTVTGLAPGQHTIQAIVANADHSLTDSSSPEVTVEVTGGEPAPGTTVTSASSGGDLGY